MYEKPALYCLAVVALSGCAAQPKYNWGSYSVSLYDYYRDATKEPAYFASLDKIIKADGPKKKIPPGILAEDGYLEMARGNFDAAISLFEREKQAWPESATFMDGAIKLARAGNKPVGPQGTPASNKPTS